jgi:hypothetical protein
MNCTEQSNSIPRTKLNSYYRKEEMLAWGSANVIASLSEEPTEGRENIVSIADVQIG